MAERLLKFAVTPRETPNKRRADARTHDFGEIYAGFAAAEAETQSSRCSQCGVPFCQNKCPLHNDIPDWLRLTAEGRLREAYELSQATSALPEVCGRICPQDRLCEGSCVVEQAGFGTVTIGAVESYLSDLAWAEGWVAPIRPARERGESVGIVGAGPAGLSAADVLKSKGYLVTVYDRHDRAGGLLTYGIPGFKLDKAVVARRVERLAEGGVVFRLDCEVGRDVGFADLRAKHDAVFVATGVYKAKELSCPGSGAEGVTKALDFLIASNRAGLGDGEPPEALNARGKRVVVVGGGDTAMDCVRTAVRQGAAEVTCLYRRDRENMPGSAREVAHAEEEGVSFDWLASPAAVSGGLRADGVTVQRMKLGAPDSGGRRAPEPVPGRTETRPADLVIKALGFDAEDLPEAFDAPDLAVTPHGSLRIPRGTFTTTLEGVFAGGDIVRGASLVVWAVKDGMDAAEAIHRWLEQRALASAKIAAE